MCLLQAHMWFVHFFSFYGDAAVKVNVLEQQYGCVDKQHNSLIEWQLLQQRDKEPFIALIQNSSNTNSHIPLTEPHSTL